MWGAETPQEVKDKEIASEQTAEKGRKAGRKSGTSLGRGNDQTQNLEGTRLSSAELIGLAWQTCLQRERYICNI